MCPVINCPSGHRAWEGLLSTRGDEVWLPQEEKIGSRLASTRSLPKATVTIYSPFIQSGKKRWT